MISMVYGKQQFKCDVCEKMNNLEKWRNSKLCPGVRYEKGETSRPSVCMQEIKLISMNKIK